MEIKLTDLDDLCLGKIIALLDSDSFRAVMFSCKRLHEITTMPVTWSIPVVKARTRFLLFNQIFLEENNSDLPQNLRELFAEAKCLTENLELFKYNIYETVWEKFGPVAAKLYLALRSLENMSASQETRVCCSLKRHRIKFELPSGKMLIVTFASFYDGTFSFDSQTKIVVDCDGQIIIYNSGYNGSNYNVLDKELQSDDLLKKCGDKSVTESSDIHCLKPIIQLLEEELGKTHPRLSPEQLICYFESIPYGCPISNEPRFKDKHKNIKPDELETRLRLAKSRAKLVNVFNQKWEKDLRAVNNRGELLWCLSTLANKLGKEAIEALDTRVDSLLNIKAELKHFDWSDRHHVSHLHPRPNPLRCILPPSDVIIKNLLNRIDFEAVKSGWTCVGNSDKHFFTKVDFRLSDAKKMVVSTSWRTSVSRIFHQTEYNDQEITFHLPHENMEVKLTVERDAILQIEQLQPLRQVIHECVYHHGDDSQLRPLVSNAFIAWFFVSVLKDTRKTHGQCLTWLRNQVQNSFQTDKNETLLCVKRIGQQIG